MPFDFKAYDAKCAAMTPEELQREWQHYTRAISGASTSTAVSGLAVLPTAGVSLIGVGLAAPAIHNARKKREIIEKHLQKHGTTHNTRKRDVLGSMAVSGTIGVVTLGVGSMGAEHIATAGAEHGISAIVENEMAIEVVTHAALDGAGLSLEHAYTRHKQKSDTYKAFQAAGTFQAVEDAKAQEAGYAVSPYGPQSQNAGSSSSSSRTEAQLAYGYCYGLPMPPPPPYSAATAPPGFVADTKAPIPHPQGRAQTYNYGGSNVPSQAPYGYGGQIQVSQKNPANPLDTPPVQPDLKAPIFHGHDQTGPDQHAAQIYDPAQTQYPHRDSYQPPAVNHPQNPNVASQGYVPPAAYAGPVVEPEQRYHPNVPVQQAREQAYQPQRPEQHAVSPQPQISQMPAVPNTGYGAYDMKSVMASLPLSTPGSEQRHQQLPPAVSAAQPNTQSISQPPQMQYSSHPAQPPVVNAPETPVLHAPRPTAPYNPVSGLTEYCTQPTPASQPFHQPPPQLYSQQQTQQSPQVPPQQPQQQPQQPYHQPSYPTYGNPAEQHQTGGGLVQAAGAPAPAPPSPPPPPLSSYKPSSYSTPAPYQTATPAATPYFPPPPQSAVSPLAYGHAPPQPQPQAASIQSSTAFPPPPSSTIASPPVRGYPISGPQYGPTPPYTPAPQPQPPAQQHNYQPYQPYQPQPQQQPATSGPYAPTPLAPAGNAAQQDYFSQPAKIPPHSAPYGATQPPWDGQAQWDASYTPAATPGAINNGHR